MSEWSKIQLLPINTRLMPRKDMPNEEWVLRSEAEAKLARVGIELHKTDVLGIAPDVKERLLKALEDGDE